MTPTTLCTAHLEGGHLMSIDECALCTSESLLATANRVAAALAAERDEARAQLGAHRNARDGDADELQADRDWYKRQRDDALKLAESRGVSLGEMARDRDAALAECVMLREILQGAVPFLADHAEEVKDLAASWPDNPDGPGAAVTASARVDRARAALAKPSPAMEWLAARDAKVRAAALEEAAMVAIRDASSCDASTLAEIRKTDDREVCVDCGYDGLALEKALATMTAARDYEADRVEGHSKTLAAMTAERDEHWANFCERSGDFKKWQAAESQLAASQAREAELRKALVEKARGPWVAVACRRGDGTETGRYNVVRPQAETWTDSKGLARPLWDHHGSGDFSKEMADEHVAALNVADAVAAALAQPASDAALRALCLRVAVAVHENDGDGSKGGTLQEVVDGVIGGGR